MEPTLPKGNSYFLNKLAYIFSQPKRGDIIVFPSPVEEKKDLVKRVIALPEDKIQIKEKIVYLNEEKLEEDYVQYTRKYETLVGDNLGPMTIPDNMIFVMGDNRDESGDSRDWKDPITKENIHFISISDIKGKLIIIH